LLLKDTVHIQNHDVATAFYSHFVPDED